ncbi:methyltransferase domain-containing protein [Tranquillimonas alkanivorans]|uniref:Methyltransferase type 11 domain-containing protein n=1 Tax=Tranquillimonas alkanivorans TaxID=441119 RepID=A0A1I5LEP9_9RHOB|nr:methyltransferase domain-containing protein [Tranquillimonas alkanivorans]SFO95844.1 hypothetical protein SAMN04488047_101622 [Tranquillimonas alkanivorans]
MQRPPELTDRHALSAHRRRAARMDEPAWFLHDEAKLELQERLSEVNRTFTDAALVTGHPELWRDAVPGARVVEDTDVLDLAPQSLDLLVHAMSLHWANDPVGQLVQALRALRPDGLFVGVMFGGQTLSELRTALAEAEARVTGGLSPRVAPMAEIRDLGGLLQRAGFALPVADSLKLPVRYRSALHLMHDLRAMGETNALAARDRRAPPRALFGACEAVYAENFTDGDRMLATFELVFLAGWAPDESQQKPLRPGSAQQRLADALGVEEKPAEDDATARRD